VIRRRDFLRAGATAAVTLGVPSFARAQGKGKAATARQLIDFTVAGTP